MRRPFAVLALITFAVLAFPASQLPASYIPPSGLTPGSQYQLIFVTAGTRDGSSGNIADYNAFVTAQAALDPSLPRTTWDAIATTSTVNGDVNAPSSGALSVYSTNGQLIAPAGIGLYSGGFAAYNRANPAVVGDQFGNGLGDGNPYNYVWLGGRLGLPYGVNEFLGAPDPWLGFNFSGFLASVAGTNPNTFQAPLYALSAPITVTPEPATLMLLASGFLAIGGVHVVRRRRTSAGSNAITAEFSALPAVR